MREPYILPLSDMCQNQCVPAAQIWRLLPKPTKWIYGAPTHNRANVDCNKRERAAHPSTRKLRRDGFVSVLTNGSRNVIFFCFLIIPSYSMDRYGVRDVSQSAESRS
jgi:hypothetical protein